MCAMRIPAGERRWPASVNAAELYPMRTSVGGELHDADLAARPPCGGVFDRPSATRMMMSAGAIPYLRRRIK